MESLAGSVKPYYRHVLIFTGDTDWPPHIEEDGLAQRLSAAVESVLGEDRKMIKITACDAPSRGPGSDLLVLPDQILYRHVQPSDLEELTRRHLVGGDTLESLAWERTPGRQILVCTHAGRDERCGRCGPPLLENLRRELEALKLDSPVQLYATSHVGGHKYAANILFYPEGDWYGYVQPADLPALLQRQLVQRQILPRLWRGRMGLSAQEQERLVLESHE